MKRALYAVALLLLITSPLHAIDETPPEIIAAKMMTKLSRGVVNVATSPIELPRQIGIQVNEKGGVGLIVGPLTGAVMTGYRAVMGAAEIALFMVPAPGYYDPMIDPEFAWVGWEAKHDQYQQAGLEKQP